MTPNLIYDIFSQLQDVIIFERCMSDSKQLCYEQDDVQKGGAVVWMVLSYLILLAHFSGPICFWVVEHLK
jgi:hypothetical protein